MATVNEIYALLDRKAPFRTQMGFDNAGFLVGRGEQEVTRVLVALDITPAVIQEAAEKGCQLILAHHPVIWGTIGRVTDETTTGRNLLALVEQHIAAICAHTNLDAAEGGVKWDDPDVGIVWPAVDGEIRLSAKDGEHRGFKEQTYEFFERW